MKFKCVILIILITSLPISSCGFGPGLADYEYDVAGNYELGRYSAHIIKVVPKDAYCSDNPPPLIPPKVVEIAWNNRFILAKQLELKEAYPDNPRNTYKIPDNKAVNYWIIDVDALNGYGPLKKRDFELKKKRLKIPSSLKLKSVTYYKD